MAAQKFDMDRLPRSLELMESGEGVELAYIDERQLPGELVVERAKSWDAVVDAIKTLAVRGAPAIGIAGAAAVALAAYELCGQGASSAEFASKLGALCDEVECARPTAVNLTWAVAQSRACADEALEAGKTPREVAEALAELVYRLQREDEATNRAIGDNGAALLAHGSRILTHCNAGSLGTYFYGTALGVVYSAYPQGKVARVYADETRPVGQGARLTTWELARVGVPTTLICDNMAASLMAAGQVDAVIVGADRIARNGDAANKIGTYGVAILAHEHGIPFYVAAPFSTIDSEILDGSSIVIEQRAASEVLQSPIEGVDVWNPAFDVTPARYIDAIITEKGVFSPQELASRL